jgi:acyl-CoA thioester hydrolase
MEVPSLPQTFSFESEHQLRWSDADLQGVVNNAVYMSLFEEARFAYFTQLAQLSADAFPFLLAQTNVLFKSPGRPGTRVTIEMVTTQLGNSSFTQAYRVTADTGKVLCEGEARLVCYDPATNASRPMSADFRAAIAQFEGL